MLFQLLLLVLATLNTVCEYGAAKHITKEEWDSSHAKYQRDLAACREDNICKTKVKNDFLPLLDEVLESGLESQMSCKKEDESTGGKNEDAEPTCGARNTVEETTEKLNIYRWLKH